MKKDIYILDGEITEKIRSEVLANKLKVVDSKYRDQIDPDRVYNSLVMPKPKAKK